MTVANDGRVDRRHTLQHVADAAGVSLRTASRVLNDDPQVAAGTRDRVQQVIRELAYTPDLVARSLRGGTDATVGLVVESIDDPFFAAVVAAVERGASADGRSVLVASTHGDPDREAVVCAELLARRVSGLLVVPTPGDHAWLTRTSCPVVLVDRAADGVVADVVGIDDRGASYAATAHLLDHGHREIGYVGDHTRTATSTARLEGFAAALRDRGLTVRPELVRAQCPAPADAAAATAELLALPAPPTALLSAATRASLGVVPALHRLGRTDVALVGFGDFALADALDPAVTVIDHAGAPVGAAAHDRLLRRLREPDLPVTTLHVPVRLVPRGSGELRP